ncbi:hypothetical protein FH972_027293 [Carpinus fangiana]|uniref:Uncharacterized protein n=1 Tax=Carpinus fangiana TaxID=176857 RepID=A0A5N6LKJ4_9ROSI|nr:hypothetical protein FH972_027293 [Carpinus fangiana]
MRHRRRLGVQTRRCSREKGRAESGGRQVVCVRTGEASKVPDSLELPSWSLVKPEGVRCRLRATRAVVRANWRFGEWAKANCSESATSVVRRLSHSRRRTCRRSQTLQFTSYYFT